MADLTFSQLEGYWIAAGGTPAMAPVMAAIALAESGGNPEATNPTDNGGRQTSWGLWQISEGNHDEPASTWADPLENAKLAVAKYKSQGLGAWGTYTSGAYKRFLQVGVSPTTPSGSTSSTTTAGVAGTATSADDSIPGILSPVVNVFKDFDSALTDIMHAVLWIINPASWVRIFAGIVGTVLMIGGLVFLVQST